MDFSFFFSLIFPAVNHHNSIFESWTCLIIVKSFGVIIRWVIHNGFMNWINWFIEDIMVCAHQKYLLIQSEGSQSSSPL